MEISANRSQSCRHSLCGDENNPKLVPPFNLKCSVLWWTSGRRTWKRWRSHTFDFQGGRFNHLSFSDTLAHEWVRLSFLSEQFNSHETGQPHSHSPPLEYKEMPGLTHCHCLFLLRFVLLNIDAVLLGNSLLGSWWKKKCVSIWACTATMCYWFHTDRTVQLRTWEVSGCRWLTDHTPSIHLQ